MAEGEPKKFKHYYGSIVRELLLVGSIIMLVELPAARQYIAIPVGLFVLAILALDLSAGLLNPLQKWTEAINLVIAIICFLAFENEALRMYALLGPANIFFITDLVLAFIFLLAIYFGVKTIRGAYVKDKTDPRN